MKFLWHAFVLPNFINLEFWQYTTKVLPKTNEFSAVTCIVRKIPIKTRPMPTDCALVGPIPDPCPSHLRGDTRLGPKDIGKLQVLFCFAFKFGVVATWTVGDRSIERRNMRSSSMDGWSWLKIGLNRIGEVRGRQVRSATQPCTPPIRNSYKVGQGRREAVNQKPKVTLKSIRTQPKPFLT